MKIGDGIIQFLRWYDTIEKQNFRKDWVKNGFRPFNVLISPQNSILPFQVMRKTSLAVVTTLDLYDENDVFVMDILPALVAPTNNHIKIYQRSRVDNIVYYQKAALTTDLPCGLHYLHLSDGVNNWYSEIFSVVANFKPVTQTPLFILNNQVEVESLLTINNSGDLLYISELPY